MLNNIVKYLSFLIAPMLFTRCYDAPIMPDEPIISFNRIEFVEVDGAADSLILTFNFEDGDGSVQP
mgnify:CR=1 FL=1